MSVNLSYSVLEEKIQNIKCSLDNLCVILDQYRDVSENREIDTISFTGSISSYHTAQDSLSLSSFSFYSALEQLELEEFPTVKSNDQYQIKLDNTITKKSVSFSQSVTILEIYSLKNKKRLYKIDQLINFKGKFIDYIYREKFYLKYKWQKLKHSIFKSNKIGNDKENNRQNEIFRKSYKKFPIIENFSETKSIDLKLFFQEIFENSLIETDLDENSVTVVRANYTVPLTDFTTVVLCKTSTICQLPTKESKTEKKVWNDEICRENIKVQPKLYTQCNSIQKSNTIENNILLKYLISKAQYPIQLKIATSIVKLNLPQWYQSSLIV